VEPGEEKARPGSPLLHYIMLVSGGQEVPNGYQALADEHVIAVSRDLKIQLHAL
jgi:hypothetical protein